MQDDDVTTPSSQHELLELERVDARIGAWLSPAIVVVVGYVFFSFDVEGAEGARSIS